MWVYWPGDTDNTCNDEGSYLGVGAEEAPAATLRLLHRWWVRGLAGWLGGASDWWLRAMWVHPSRDWESRSGRPCQMLWG